MESEALSDQLVREGVVALNSQDFFTAREKFKKAIEIHSKNVDAFYNLGAAELSLNNALAAIKAYQDALVIAPTDYEVMYNLGTVYLGNGNVEESINYFKKAIEINPYYINAFNNLGVAYQYVNDFDKSAKIYEEVIRIKEDDPTAYNNLGVAITKQGLPSRAIPHFQKAIELNETYSSAYNNLANALQQLGSYEDALEYYKKALEFQPNYSEALINIASNYHELRNLESSVENYEKALELEPENPQAISHLLHIYQQTCDFKKVDTLKTRLKKQNQDPLINIMYSDDLNDNLSVASEWSKRIEDKASKYPKFEHEWLNNKIKIAYLNNFQDKPVGYLIKDMFKLHDRRKFEVYAFSFGSSPGGDLREQVAKDVDHFIDIASLTNYEAAKLINEKQIDILVDLKGYTKGERIEVMAMRPAKLQITYLGFPGTTGADFFDYIITDKILTPPSMQKYFSEKFMYMKGCYQVYSKPTFQKLPVKLSDYNLPSGKFIFSSLNQTVKIDEKVMNSWMTILKKVPDSVLWLHGSNDIAIENLKTYAMSKHVDPSRLIFADSVPFEEHLSRIPLVDLALDPFQYSGGATTAHTLWMGVPVLTKQGKHYLSRMSDPQIIHAGLKSLVCKTTKEYEKSAIDLATNPKRLEKLKTKLKKTKRKLDMFNTKKFVRDLEKNYEKIIARKSNK